jgi:hypothetical protein
VSLPRLILDTSACKHIAKSSRRAEIEAQIDKRYRRVVSVPTFWELLEQFKGDHYGTHFRDDKEVIRVAAGTRRPALMLPHPLAYAIETVLKLKPQQASVNPDELRRLYEVIVKAATMLHQDRERFEQFDVPQNLFFGDPLSPGMRDEDAISNLVGPNLRYRASASSSRSRHPE